MIHLKVKATEKTLLSRVREYLSQWCAVLIDQMTINKYEDDTDLCRNVNEPLVEEKAHVAVEHVGDVLEDGLVPPRGGLLQEEGPQPGHGLSRDSNQDENT